jgi:hypothetical protein
MWTYRNGWERTSPSQQSRVHRHKPDGDWQFLCGTTNRPKDGQVVSLGCIFERDNTIVHLADLPEGWRAYRVTHGAVWTRERVDGA